MSNQLSISSQPATLESAFGSFHEEKTNSLEFDVISSFQPGSKQPTFSSPVTLSKSKNINKQFYGVVKISSSNSGYEVYTSNNSDESLILKGHVADTNVNTFMFPISDIKQDYFVLVYPYTKQCMIQQSIEPWSTLEIQRNTYEEKDVKTIPNTQLRKDPNCIAYPRPQINELPSVKGKAIFRIFYTTQILKERKANINLHKKIKKANESFKQKESESVAKRYEDMLNQRESDIKNILKTREDINKTILSNKTHDTHIYTDVMQSDKKSKYFVEGGDLQNIFNGRLEEREKCFNASQVTPLPHNYEKEDILMKTDIHLNESNTKSGNACQVKLINCAIDKPKSLFECTQKEFAQKDSMDAQKDFDFMLNTFEEYDAWFEDNLEQDFIPHTTKDKEYNSA